MKREPIRPRPSTAPYQYEDGFGPFAPQGSTNSSFFSEKGVRPRQQDPILPRPTPNLLHSSSGGGPGGSFERSQSQASFVEFPTSCYKMREPIRPKPNPPPYEYFDPSTNSSGLPPSTSQSSFPEGYTSFSRPPKPILPPKNKAPYSSTDDRAPLTKSTSHSAFTFAGPHVYVNHKTKGFKPHVNPAPYSFEDD